MVMLMLVNNIFMSPQEAEELVEYANNNKMLAVAIKGALSEIRHKNHLSKSGYKVSRIEESDNLGLPDFQIEDNISMEHKRARNQTYADGSLKVEIQKSRNSGKCKSNRLYDEGFCDIVSVDISEHTGKTNDYRYIKTTDLEKDSQFPNKIKALQRESRHWKSNLCEVLKATNNKKTIDIERQDGYAFVSQ